jgi:hypothetical protein
MFVDYLMTFLQVLYIVEWFGDDGELDGIWKEPVA